MSLAEKVAVKLGVAKEGEETLFRRIDLSRHGTFGKGNGKNLYKTLKLYAIQSSTSAHDLPDETALSRCQVTLFYYDVDGDKIMIGSAAELKDALRMYEKEKVVKIMAEVVPGANSGNLPSRAAMESATQTVVQESGKDAVLGAPDVTVPPPPQHQLQSLVDTLVGRVIAPAVISIRAASEHAARAVAEAEAASLAAARAPDSPSPSAPPAEGDSKESATPLFIHGRHTCDGCLTTPIIGKRFHAVNLPDYDLCERCKGNYKGDEIRFEEAELDRDRPFQERWQRRRAKWGPHAQHYGCHRGMRGHHHRHQGHHPCRSSFGVPAPHAGPSPEEVDLALKEAIRRSLQDLKTANKKKEGTVEEVQAKGKEAPTTAASTSAKRASEPQFDVKPPAKGTSTEEDESSDDEEMPLLVPRRAHYLPVRDKVPVFKESVGVVPPSMIDSSFADDAEGNGDVAAVLGETLDKVAEAIDAMNIELARQSSNDGGEDDSDDEDDIIVEGIGMTIVNGEDTTKDDDESSKGSWVVEDTQFASDEALARAAQVIGSALFNSDMVQSTENTTTHNGASISSSSVGASHSFSSVGSVPTTVASVSAEPHASAAQLDRWAVQLSQLHELGFYNDPLLVEVIERLTAANIGVDSDDEVTVQQVINELMKDW